jgi:hypothetical protein
MCDEINQDEMFGFSPQTLQTGGMSEDFLKMIAKYDQEKNYDKLEELLWLFKRHYDKLSELFRGMGNDLASEFCRLDNVPVR